MREEIRKRIAAAPDGQTYKNLYFKDIEFLNRLYENVIITREVHRRQKQLMKKAYTDLI
jgi:hypothetical protein